MANEFILINGWEVDVSYGEFQKSQQHIGTWQRLFSGKIAERRLRDVRAYSGAAKLDTASNQEKLRQLLLGYGELFNFEYNAHSFKGVKSESGGTWARTASAGVDGTYSLRVTGGSTFTIQDVVDQFYWTGKWTLIFSHKVDSEATSAYERYGVRSSDTTSQQWENGVQGTHSISNMCDFSDVPGSGFIFQGATDAGASDDADYDLIVILPFEASDEQMAIWTLNTNRFSRLPFLQVALADESAIEMLGDAELVEYKRYTDSSGTLQVNGKCLEFVLEEV